MKFNQNKWRPLRSLKLPLYLPAGARKRTREKVTRTCIAQQRQRAQVEKRVQIPLTGSASLLSISSAQ